jgi:hypothetical protein
MKYTSVVLIQNANASLVFQHEFQAAPAAAQALLSRDWLKQNQACYLVTG